MQTALITLADGFEELEAVAIIDVLRRGEVQVVTASLNAERLVTSAHGIPFMADVLLKDVSEEVFDAIILPGGGLGTENLKKSEMLTAMLQRQKSEGRLLCAICAAPTVLAAAGVLEGEHITCYPSCAASMLYAVKNVPVIADGQIVTGQGPGQAVTFALVLLSQLVGEPIAQKVANGMLVEWMD